MSSMLDSCDFAMYISITYVYLMFGNASWGSNKLQIVLKSNLSFY